MRSAQELFDVAVKGVVAQGCRSKGPDGCMYRGPNDTKCAVGFLVDDETARDWDAQAADGVLSDVWSVKLPDELKDHVEMLDRLQFAHDAGSDSGSDANFVAEFLERAERVAELFKLTMPEINQSMTQKLYKVDVQVWATAYIKAEDLEEAQQKRQMLDSKVLHPGMMSDDPYEDLMKDNSKESEITFSPLMTISVQGMTDLKLVDTD